jgi:uncharacterized membrane protein YheB (UPF0754 family)
MTNPALIAIPLLTAFTGWLVVWLIGKLLFSPLTPKKIAGFTIQGLLPALQPVIAAKAGQMAKAQFSLTEIEQKITSPETVQQIMPVVEGHIDFFLREKLKEKMPMISMFIGEKTIAELKEVFLAEIAAMFPELIKGYLNNLQKDLDLEQAISSKISAVPAAQLKSIILTDGLQKQLNKAAFAGGFIGLIIGLVQLAILLIA